MTLFLDLRASSRGGIVADEAQAWDDGVKQVTSEEFSRRITGKDLLLACHGFNVDREGGIASLSLWSQRCALPANALFIGLLWPGDSRFVPFIDYVYEGAEAISSGKLLAGYLNKNGTPAQSLGFFSHSLGARVVLETIRRLNSRTRRAILMAGAIEDDCLAREYADVGVKVDRFCVVASVKDDVLKWAYPPGNLVGEIVMHGHPYDRTALGRSGPQRPLPSSINAAAIQLPKGWDYGHLDYLAQKPLGPSLNPPLADPGPSDPKPVDDTNQVNAGWKPAWSAAATVTYFK